MNVLERSPQVESLGATNIPRYALFESLVDEGERVLVVGCLEGLEG